MGKRLIYSILLLVALLGLTKAIFDRTSFPKVLSNNSPKVHQTIEWYQPPQIATNSAYTVIFVGDSMTDALGPNFDALRPLLANYYPNKVFGLFNYGYGSTNVLSVEERLTQDTTYLDTKNFAILNREFDIIIIESFGHNPLSQYSLEEGLKVQTQTLDRLIALIADTKPKSLIVFLATIAPSQSHYALKTVDLSPEKRRDWANERRFYIENHINYAKKHNIPLINVYEKSLDKNGLALLKYINPDDYIHPSREGIKLISGEIADFLFKNKILP